MNARDEEVRPAPSGPAPRPTVRRPKIWQADPRNQRAIERHITQTYGGDWARRSR